MFKTIQVNETYSLRTCDIGDTVYMPVYNGIVIPCRVIGKSVVYPGDEKGSVWGYFHEGRQPMFLAPTEEIGEGGWHVSKEVEQPTSQQVNEFLSLDEPVGHDVQLGDEAYETLKEAMDQLIPRGRKHLGRRLKEYRYGMARWIASTWRAGNSYGKVKRADNKELLDAYKACLVRCFEPKRVYAKRR